MSRHNEDVSEKTKTRDSETHKHIVVPMERGSEALRLFVKDAKEHHQSHRHGIYMSTVIEKYYEAIEEGRLLPKLPPGYSYYAFPALPTGYMYQPVALGNVPHALPIQGMMPSPQPISPEHVLEPSEEEGVIQEDEIIEEDDTAEDDVDMLDFFLTDEQAYVNDDQEEN